MSKNTSNSPSTSAATQSAIEVNFDGLIGNTHNYAGLSLGNLASADNAMKISQPKLAAKQGLQKMKCLHDLGMKQGFFIPQERPHIPSLRQLGFSGKDADIIANVAKRAPHLLTATYSASSMWAANAATVSPSCDTQDQRVHFTAANLKSMLHRSIEHPTTTALLKTIFADEKYFAHHSALQLGAGFGDEGAANHSRFCENYSSHGVEFFVYGKRDYISGTAGKPALATTFPARQSYEASEAIARLHGLNDSKVVFAQQNPDIIDAGGFHNDVVSVANKNVLFMHELAFHNKAQAFEQLQRAYGENPLHFVEVPTEAVPLQDAIQSYLFNSQLISLTDNSGMALILPVECRNNKNVAAYLEQLLSLDTPIKTVKYVDVRQSMQNGGGPACLRLRVVLSEDELAHVNQSFLFSDTTFATLNNWIDTHYRDELPARDITDPALLTETRTALDELTQLLNIGSFYEFQRV